jgi:hypothetical protein
MRDQPAISRGSIEKIHTLDGGDLQSVPEERIRKSSGASLQGYSGDYRHEPRHELPGDSRFGTFSERRQDEHRSRLSPFHNAPPPSKMSFYGMLDRSSMLNKFEDSKRNHEKKWVSESLIRTLLNANLAHDHHLYY